MAEQTQVRETVLFDEKRAVTPEQFREISIDLIPQAYQVQESRFGPDSDDEQFLHRSDIHLVVATDRAKRMIAVGRKANPDFITPIQEGRAFYFIPRHDCLQNRKLDPQTIQYLGTIQEERVRDRSRYEYQDEGNEMGTAGEIAGSMWKVNNDHGKMIFIQQDVLVCRSAMAATIPVWDGNLRTVVQPHLRPGIPVEAALAGLADLAGAGMDGPQQYIKEGNAEFQEVKIGITRAIKEARKNAKGLPLLKAADRTYVTGQIKAWLVIQIHFAEGRKAMLDQDLSSLDDERVRTAFKEELFTKFDESIESARDRARDLEKKDFEQLLTLIGYIEPQPVLPATKVA